MWLIIALALIPLCYFLIKRPHKFWTEKGVKQGNPVFLFGDAWGNITKKQSYAELTHMLYNIGSTERYVGAYQFLSPALVLRDPDLIKQVTVKDFDHFVNHPAFTPENSDPLWTKNLFALKDQNWREMRAILSPAFTASKMKYMFTLINEKGQQFAQHYLAQDGDTVTVEMKDAFTRFTNDVIASTAFGVQCDSLGERNNEFYLMGKELVDFSGFWHAVKTMAYFLAPSMCKIFNVTLFSKRVCGFFTGVIKESIASREEHGLIRPDMLNLLLEARKSKQEEAQLSDTDITAQALLFFLGGFDSVSSLMCLMSYELALNPEVQERLRCEVDAIGSPTYEALTGMKYMDMVVSETQRLWPSSVVTDRVCTKPYTIEPTTPDEKPLHLEENSVIWLPTYGLHRDPKYFPNPERFDPERFSDENKGRIKPYSYLPFGSGPRNCIGSRFALLETKALFYHLLLHFEIVPIERTKVPFVISKDSFNLTAEGGFWLGLRRRIK